MVLVSKQPLIDKMNLANEALHLMMPKIKRSVLNTSNQDREDLEQEIKLKVIEAVLYNKVESPPTFWDFQKQFYEKRQLA